ncbi:helix-turn-helix domain-containing protein [Nakamurella endophytica]|uniref:helix-turn-helix domain-containing protein n=1 Tax=Nakamurella endophytica TaxID=1748367 RepID=UPI0016640539|nr:helix-turn-helix domain-containing protein [Nakamurella endophytica]
MRESRSGGHTYLRRWERPLTDRRPAVPAAIPLYSGVGDTRTLVIDLDTSRGGPDAVHRDTAALTALITGAGGQLIQDHSPTGGVHLYLPLQQPLGFHDARDLALALAARTPTMDPAPNQNLTDGLIRPPGSPHPRGGHQRLDTPLSRAYAIARTRNPAAVINNLRHALAAELAALHTQPANDAAHSPDGTGSASSGTELGHRPRRGGPRDLPADYLAIATTGQYNPVRYRSPSEARQAVLSAAVWAGHTLPQLLARIDGGHWPGLASFYTRYRNPHTRRKALLADWRNALAWVTANQHTHRAQNVVRNSPTSQPPTHGGHASPTVQDHRHIDDSIQQRRGTAAEYQWIRSWWTALQLLEHRRYTGRSAVALRWVLRALGEAAHKSGSRYIAFGVRSLSIATGLDHTTVAAHLRTLRSEDDPFLDLIEDDRGLAADLYTLRIPDEATQRAHRTSWPAGRLHALRPVFRELGHTAATVYEALEHTREPVRSFDLLHRTGLSRSATHTALQTLAAWNLIQQRHGRWHIVAGTSLVLLAEQFGCLDAVRDLIDRHRTERAAYRAAYALTRRAGHTPGTPLLPPLDDDWPPPPEPPDQHQTLLDLLEQQLGAHPIATHTHA